MTRMFSAAVLAVAAWTSAACGEDGPYDSSCPMDSVAEEGCGARDTSDAGAPADPRATVLAVFEEEVPAPPMWSGDLHLRACPSEPAERPLLETGRFVDVARFAGVQGPERDPCPDDPLECHATSMTGGIAVGDFDEDGYPDLYVPRVRANDSLYLNCRDGRFVDVAEQVGIDKASAPSSGAAWADVDADGDLDLYVTTFGLHANRHYLFLQNGDGTFREDGINRGVSLWDEGPLYGTGVTFGDYDGDGYVDLYVGEWRQDSLVPLGEPTRNHARLFRNLGRSRPGFFQDVTQQAGVALGGITSNGIATLEGVFVFTPTFADLDGDGAPDLVLTGDYGSSRVFWNRKDGAFEDGTVPAQVGTDQAGMGSAIGDYDGDSKLDWFVTSIYEKGRGYNGNRLFRNLGGRRFEDSTDASGMRDVGWGWGASMLDFDNDGDLDTLAVSGFTNNEGARTEYEGRIALFRNPGREAFLQGVASADVAPQLMPAPSGQGRGVAVLDFDRDGDLDLFVVYKRGFDALLRNDIVEKPRGFLRIVLRGTTNTHGLGARVILTSESGAQVRELSTGAGYLSQSESVVHFGFGEEAEGLTVDIHWPFAAVVQRVENVVPNRVVVAQEP